MKGIAITTKSGNGTWQYSIDGTSWASLARNQVAMEFVAFVTTSFAASYAVWLATSATLVADGFASTPTWKLFDVVPFLEDPSDAERPTKRRPKRE